MRLAAHLSRMIWETVRYTVSTRRVTLLIVLVLGLLLLALSVTAQTVAPLALYPFA